MLTRKANVHFKNTYQRSKTDIPIDIRLNKILDWRSWLFHFFGKRNSVPLFKNIFQVPI